MKLPAKKTIISTLITLAIGIVIGTFIPGIISSFKLRKAEKQALQQLEKYPEDANSWLVISNYKWQRGDQEGSFAAAHKALELDPNYVLAIEKIAYNYLDMGELKKGKVWLEKALKVAEVHSPGQVEMIKFAIAVTDNKMKP